MYVEAHSLTQDMFTSEVKDMFMVVLKLQLIGRRNALSKELHFVCLQLSLPVHLNILMK